MTKQSRRRASGIFPLCHRGAAAAGRGRCKGNYCVQREKEEEKGSLGGSLGKDGFNVCAVLARKGWPLVVVVEAGK